MIVSKCLYRPTDTGINGIIQCNMNKQNLPLIFGISLPIVFIIIISLVLFVPSISIKPAHNFIYSFEDSYGNYYKNIYVIDKNRITTSPIKNPSLYTDKQQKYTSDNSPIYLYNVSEDTSRQISLEDAKNLLLDPGPSSPDGYNVSYQYNSGDLFFGQNNSGYYIFNNKGKKKINGIANGPYSGYGNFKVVGWVK